MKKTALITLSLLSLAAVVFGVDEKKEAAQVAPKELKPQTLCPVMGKPIDSSAYTDLQGQRVYHCCPMCSAKLKADPDKYFKKAAAEGVLFQNIQENCPVSGEPIDTTKFVDYQGRRIYFCCEKCPTQFAANPQKYLKAMGKPSEKKAETNENQGDHRSGPEGHGGH